MYDTQDHHLYVRLLTACEMILHPQWYDVSSPSCLLKDDRIATPDVQQAISDVVSVGKYVDLLHFYAISSALDVTIQSYTPPTALVGLGTSPYTVLVAGRSVRHAKAPAMTLMWSAATVPVNGEAFRPDHIVLLAERPTVTQAVIDVNDSTATCDYDRCAADDSANVTVLDNSGGANASIQSTTDDDEVCDFPETCDLDNAEENHSSQKDDESRTFLYVKYSDTIHKSYAG